MRLADAMGIRSAKALSLIDPGARPPLLNFPRITPDWTNWDNWGNASEVEGWARIESETYARSIVAALEGEGIALASPHVLAAELGEGQLLQLAPVAQSTRHAYFLAFPDTRPLRPDVQRLLDFLFAGTA